jgi:putative redox protein
VALDRTPRTGPIESIEMVLTLEGELTGEQRERLAQVAARCRVHRALAEGVRVTHAGH